MIYAASLNIALIPCSAISFLGYGSACFYSAYLEREFVRYGLGAQRRWVGVLQVSAALGLLAGLGQAWMGQAAAAGSGVMAVLPSTSSQVKARRRTSPSPA